MTYEIHNPIVVITSKDPGNKAFGTGFAVFEAEGWVYLITSAHVIEDVGGEKNVKLKNANTAIVALGCAEGPDDVAVLKVEGRLATAPLGIDPYVYRGKAITIKGFQMLGDMHSIKPIEGEIGKHIGLERGDEKDRVKAWILNVTDNDHLQHGYSGAPVLSSSNQRVLAIVTHRFSEGRKGVAIAIDTIRSIWPNVPDQLLEPKATRGVSPARSDQAELEILALKRRITQHQSNISALDQMVHNHESETPAHLLISIATEREQVQQLQQKLEALQIKGNHAGPNQVPLPTNLPQTTYFVGRVNEIDDALNALHHDSRSFIVSIEGQGGVGKSELAIELGHRCLRERRFSAVIWISAKESILRPQGIFGLSPEMQTIQDMFNVIGQVLKFPSIGMSPLNEQRRMALELLGQQPTLLIIDNFETLHATVQNEIIAFLRQTPLLVKSIITTRTRLVEGFCIRLQGLPPEESGKLLLWNARQKDIQLREEQIQRIVSVTGGIPLAMLWVEGQISLFGFRVGQIMDKLSASPDVPILQYCFKSSWDQLASNQNIVRILIALSLHIESAGRDALKNIAAIEDANLFEELLGNLTQLSLINLDPKQNRLFLQPLTKEFIESQYSVHSDLLSSMEERMTLYYDQMIEAYGDFERWREYDDILTDRLNILSVVDRCHRRVITAAENGKLHADDRAIGARIIHIAIFFGGILWQRAYWYDRLVIAQSAIEVAEILKDWKSVGTLSRNIAWIFYYQGDNANAKAWAELSLEAVSKTDIPLLIMAAQRALGAIELRLENYTAAERLLTEALSICESRQNDDYAIYSLGFVQNGLGELELARGNIKEATEWFERSAKTWKNPDRIEPVRHISYSLNNLGSVALRKGNDEEAARYFEDGLDAAMEFGRMDEIARSKLGLAQIALKRKDFTECQRLATEARKNYLRLGMRYELQQIDTLLQTCSTPC